MNLIKFLQDFIEVFHSLFRCNRIFFALPFPISILSAQPLELPPNAPLDNPDSAPPSFQPIINSYSLDYWLNSKTESQEQNAESILSANQKLDPVAAERDILNAVENGSISYEDAIIPLLEIRKLLIERGDLSESYRAERPVIPSSLMDQIEEVRSQERSLRNDLQIQIQSLGNDPSYESIRVTIENFKTSNHSRLEQINQLRMDAHQKLESYQTDRPSRFEVTDNMSSIRDELTSLNQELVESKNSLSSSILGVPQEIRWELHRQYRSETKSKYELIKTKNKSIKKEARSIVETGALRSVDL